MLFSQSVSSASMIRCWRMRLLVGPRREMKRNVEDGIQFDGTAVELRRFKFPLAESFGGAAIEAVIESAQQFDRVHAPVFADDGGQADLALDAVLSRGRHVFRVHFAKGNWRLQ